MNHTHRWVLITEESYYYSHDVAQDADGKWVAKIDFGGKPTDMGGLSLLRVECVLCGENAPDEIEQEAMESYYA